MFKDSEEREERSRSSSFLGLIQQEVNCFTLKRAAPEDGISVQLLLFSGLTQQCHFGAFGIGSPFSQALIT